MAALHLPINRTLLLILALLALQYGAAVTVPGLARQQPNLAIVTRVSILPMLSMSTLHVHLRHDNHWRHIIARRSIALTRLHDLNLQLIMQFGELLYLTN